MSLPDLANNIRLPRWRNSLLLFLIPVLTFIVMSSTLLNNRNVYMHGGDPMYAYLLNSLSLAQGEFDIGHTDNPGTTVQVFGALILRAVFLFRSADTIQSDVIVNPEYYLMICRFAQLILITALLIYLGRVVMQSRTGGITLALIMQSSVLSGVYILIQSASFAPEGLLIASGVVMLILCWKYLDQIERNEVTSVKYVWAFGMLCGFATVTKLPALVYVAIPFLTLEGIRRKIVFLTSFVLATAFFLLPVFNKLESLFGFVGGLLTHSGTYGTGKEEFVDTSTVLPNLEKHFFLDTFFFLVLILSLLTLIVGFLRNGRAKMFGSSKHRVLAGIALAMLGNLFIATKHFGLHYMIPTQVLLVFACVLLCEIWKVRMPVFTKRITKSALTVIAIAFPLVFFARFYSEYYYNPGFRQIRYDAQSVMKKYPDAARIYIGDYPAAATPEPAFYFGWAYCGNIRTQYSELIQKYYPDAFMYNANLREYNGFGLRASPLLLMREHAQIIFYSTEKDTAMLKALIAEWSAMSDINGSFVQTNRLYSSTASSELIYLLQIDTARVKQKFPCTRTLVCNFDEVVSDSLFATCDTAVFVNRFQFTPAGTSLSGKGALFTDKGNTTGSVMRFPVVPGAQYVITMWRRGDAYNSWINTTDGTSAILFQSGAFVTGNSMGEWKEVRMNLFVPVDYPQETVQLMITSEQDQPLWIDNLRIEEYAPGKP